MPSKTITVCATCGKKSCDGGIWKWVRVTRIEDGVEEPLSEIPFENQVGCSLSHGNFQYKHLKSQPVGAQVSLTYRNWERPSVLVVEKIEE